MKYHLIIKPLKTTLFIVTFVILYTGYLSYSAVAQTNNGGYNGIVVGAVRTNLYLPLLDSTKRVAIVANKTSYIGKKHLVDSMLKAKVNITKIFALEHGFRGDAANGEHIANEKDPLTGLEIISLYGSKSKPTAAQLNNVDIVVFDIQDVGVRYYTFLSSLHYLIEACAEFKKTLLVLDRPNPNGYYVDGPILEKGFESMVGLHPIPLVHGMTLGELAKMINFEKWTTIKDTCKLIVIPCLNYAKSMMFNLPIAPSPNLPNSNSIVLYPSLGMFEGTIVSMGRGTNLPFQCIGAPWLKSGTINFTPVNMVGKAVNPPYLNTLCKGYNLTDFASNYLITHKKIYLEWLLLMYDNCPDKNVFFNANFFDKLAGNSSLRNSIIQGKSSNDIRKSWEAGLSNFKEKRKPYLLYAD